MMGIFAMIAAGIALICTVFMLAALWVDTLFEEGGIECGWDEKRGGGTWTKWSDDSNQETAGEIWLVFAIFSLLAGMAALFCFCLIPTKSVMKIVAMVLLGFAGFFAFIAALGAFYAGNRKGTCYGDLDVGISVILAFIAGFFFLLAMCLMLMDAVCSKKESNRERRSSRSKSCPEDTRPSYTCTTTEPCDRDDSSCSVSVEWSCECREQCKIDGPCTV